MCENVLFFFSRVATPKNQYIIETLLKKVQNEKMVENGSFRDHVMLMNICNSYKIDVPQLWGQIEKIFNESFLKN